jgi:diketogulonate reductase-like aldo/keto reductase
MERFKLNNGTFIPAVGLGTFLMSPDDAEAAVTSALTSGYTLVDTANAYNNEKAVGRGIRNSGIRRSDLFLSTKLWPPYYGQAEQAIDDTLERLGVDYVDLLFLHQPVGEVEHAWQAMEQAVKAGKVRSLGLSNFPMDQLRSIVEHSTIKPAVIQVEAHPYYPQTRLAGYLKSFGAVIMAWYPLGHGDKRLIQEPVFTGLAAKYHKSSAQIILRWHVQMGHVVIPGSRNPQHIKDNADLFDFALTDQEMAQIAALDKNTPYYQASPEALQNYLNTKIDFDAQK